MKIIIGPGNPGKKFEKTRHNLGFEALDYICENLGSFEKWLVNKKTDSLICRGNIGNEKIILAKPQTFMNLSGQAAKKLLAFYKIKSLDDLLVIHDDFDLPLGIIRISKNASAAGHKGVKSIIEELGSKNFYRLRLGIYPIGQTFKEVHFKKVASIEKFVLKKFAKNELSLVKGTTKKAAQAAETAIKESPETAMNQFN